MIKKRLLVIPLVLVVLVLFGAKMKTFLSMSKPKPSFSLFLHPSTLCFTSFFDHLTDQKGCPSVWGDGVFSYGVWDLRLDPELEKSHFSKKEADRKVLVSINLKDLLLREVKELEKKNRPTFSGLDYLRFRSLATLEEKLIWVLEDDVLLNDFCQQVKIACQYASRKDVFVFHGEYLLDPNLYEEAQVQIKALSKFLNCPSKKEDLHLDEYVQALSASFEVGGWKEVFNEELEALFSKKLGCYQTKLGY